MKPCSNKSFIPQHSTEILRKTRTLVLLLLSFTVYLSAQNLTTPVFLKKKFSNIKEILVLPIEFDCYFLTSGGIREYNNKMSVQSREEIQDYVCKLLTKKSFSITTLPKDSYIIKCWTPLRHFYSAVNNEILKNVYGSTPLPDAVATFRYSIPPIPDSLLYPTTDAVLFIDGFDDRATDKRISRKAAAAAVSAVSVVTVILVGQGVFVTVPSDKTVASCALVDRSGAIIWYYKYERNGNIDMTSRNDITDFFSRLFVQLPENGPQNDIKN